MITAEVNVDETDIVNVQLGQPAEVTIDAIPKKIFKGDGHRNRETMRLCAPPASRRRSKPGSSQEAKDFKVVVTLQDPPPNLRPGFRRPQNHHRNT